MPIQRHSKAVAPYSESDAWHAKTHELWDTGQYRLAFRRFLVAAKLGDSTAQLLLGYFYDCGIGVSRRQALALHWYKKAHRQGNMSAANNAGTIYRDRGDFSNALMWFERAAALGDVDSNWNTATMYFRQRNDVPRTIHYLKRILEAKPGVDVTQWNFEAATRLLWRLKRRQITA